jgi:hypothetical protein
MTVRDEDAIKPLEANAGDEDLALGAFAAIHQKPVFIVFDNQRR